MACLGSLRTYLPTLPLLLLCCLGMGRDPSLVWAGPNGTVAGPSAIQAETEALAQEQFIALTRETHDDWAVSLVRLADRFASTTVAPEALFLAAQHLVDVKAQPEAALALFQRLLRDYPDSRLVRRAQRQVAQLEQGMRSGAAVYATFLRIVSDTAPGSVSRQQQLSRFLCEHPDFARADHVLFLLLTDALRRPDADPAACAAWHKELSERFSASDFAARASLTYAEWLTRRGEFARARAALSRLRTDPATPWHLAAEAGLAAANRAERRYWLAVVLGGVLAVWFVGLAVKHARRLWPPPGEFYYYAPVAAFFVLVAFWTQGWAFARSLALLALLGVLLAWLSGAAGRAPGGRAAWGLLWRLFSALGLIYLAVERQGLWELTLETLRTGP